MRLTLQTDYSLRVLMYVGARPELWVSSQRLAVIYDASANHISKVAKDLVTRGYLRSRRGHTGGFQLAVRPEDVNIGQLVRELENLDLLDCFESATGACLLSPACSLRSALLRAQRAFVETLDAYTLADLIHAPASLRETFLSRERLLDS